MRKNLSSVFGGKGLFNLSLVGKGFCALESFVPREELYEFDLKDDTVKIDGNMAVCWSGSLEFTVERSSKSLFGSMMNGEGLVNVYRGTGKILMAPTLPGAEDEGSHAPKWRSQGRPRPLRRGGEGRIRLPALRMQSVEPPRPDGGQVSAPSERRVQGMPFASVVRANERQNRQRPPRRQAA